MLVLWAADEVHRRGRHAGTGVPARQARSPHSRPSQVRLPSLPGRRLGERRCRQRPIPGGIAGPGLITEMFVGKFGDHLPLYRLEDFFTRYGVYLSRSTQCDWVKGVALSLPSVVRAPERAGAAVPRDVDRRHACHRAGRRSREVSRATSGRTSEKSILTPCTTSPPVALAPARRVFWQDIQATCTPTPTAATTRYLSRGRTIRASRSRLLGHARRKFFEAMHSSPREAHQMLEWIRQLYDIEDRARDVVG